MEATLTTAAPVDVDAARAAMDELREAAPRIAALLDGLLGPATEFG